MKILTLIPHYKRPEVLEKTIEQLPEWVNPVYILSPEDKFLEQNKEIIKDSNNATDYFHVNNEPLNFKMNEGVRGALVNYDFDYLMFLNSDTLINPRYLDYIKIALGGKIDRPIIGLTDLYCTDINFSEAYLWKYPINYPLGSGRLVRRDVIENIDTPFPGNQNSGIDGLFANTAREYGYEFTLLPGDQIPLICDIKTATNLTPLDEIKNKRDSLTVNWSNIERYFYA